MNSLRERKKVINTVETVFNLLYLATAVICAAFLFASKGQFKLISAFCAAALFLGDLAHLAPRIAAMHSSKRDYTAAMGIGKLITSLGMTLFYFGLLFAVKSYYGFESKAVFWAIIFGAVLSAIRIGICLMPQNKWAQGGGSVKMGVYRNIPFTALGLLAAGLFFAGGLKLGGLMSAVWALIILSFIFYIPVVLYANKYPKIGMLMLPKSLAYAAVLIIFTVI